MIEITTGADVGIIMGSDSDWPTMQHAADVLDLFAVAYDCRVVSAHRTPEYMMQYAQQAHSSGLKTIIAGAGGAAHLPGMVAAATTVPVIGVPVKSSTLSGLDSLYSIVQMPGGVPVATMAIGHAGAKNAGLLAVAMLARYDDALHDKLLQFRKEQSDKVMAIGDPATNG